jgi:hypothetical protein
MSIQKKKGIPNVVRATRTKMNLQITSADLTPAYMPAASLATTDAPNHSINAVRLQSATKRKKVNVKFQVKKINRRIDKNEKGVGNEIFQSKKISRNTDKNEHGIEKESFTTTIAAQGDTGANCSATNTIDIIHNYKKFAVPQEVGVFLGDETSTTLQALGEGVIKILSDQGSIMEWTVLYMLLSSGTMLSHKSKYYDYYHLGTSESTGKIGFLDYNQREVESIQMKRTHNGEWLTTNQVLVSSPIKNKHIIQAVSQRSDRIRNLQTERNDNMQAEEDRMVMDQQVNESWVTDIGAHHFNSMSETHPIFTEVKLKTTDTPQQAHTQKMKELELWHQRMGHCSTRTLNETR